MPSPIDAASAAAETKATYDSAARTYQDAASSWNAVSWLMIGAAALWCFFPSGRRRLL